MLGNKKDLSYLRCAGKEGEERKKQQRGIKREIKKERKASFYMTGEKETDHPSILPSGKWKRRVLAGLVD